MTVTNNSYTVEEIERAVASASAAMLRFPAGTVGATTAEMLPSLYLGVLDSDKPQAKSAGGGQ